MRSSISFWLSVGSAGGSRPRTLVGLVPVVRVLVLLDQPLHLHGVALSMSVTADGAGAAARLDQHVGEQYASVDLHRRNVRHVNRFFLLADPAWRVLHDRGRSDEHL